MAPRHNRFILLSLIVLLWSSLLPATPAYALAKLATSEPLPPLERFVEQLRNGQAHELRGLYIPNMLAAPVIQQPAGMEGFVSPWKNAVTQFSLASRLGSTGLLAHNDLAGEAFAALQMGQEIYLVYGDGLVSTFVVSDLLRYQAVHPESTTSSFLNVENGDILNSSALFTRIYHRPGQVILQTCIESEDTHAWGRLFVIAKPVTN